MDVDPTETEYFEIEQDATTTTIFTDGNNGDDECDCMESNVLGGGIPVQTVSNSNPPSVISFSEAPGCSRNTMTLNSCTNNNNNSNANGDRNCDNDDNGEFTVCSNRDSFCSGGNIGPRRDDQFSALDLNQNAGLPSVTTGGKNIITIVDDSSSDSEVENCSKTNSLINCTDGGDFVTIVDDSSSDSGVDEGKINTDDTSNRSDSLVIANSDNCLIVIIDDDDDSDDDCVLLDVTPPAAAIMSAEIEILESNPIKSHCNVVVDGQSVVFNKKNSFNFQRLLTCFRYLRNVTDGKVKLLLNSKYKKLIQKHCPPYIAQELERDKGSVTYIPKRYIDKQSVEVFDKSIYLRCTLLVNGLLLTNRNFRSATGNNIAYRQVVKERVISFLFRNDQKMVIFTRISGTVKQLMDKICA